MEKGGLTISPREAQEILEIMSNLEGEFAGCWPEGGKCRDQFDPRSVQCGLCNKLRAYLDQGMKEG